MLELAILGFLAEGPVHGYELRKRIAHLSGFARVVSDGSLYPAIKRLERQRLITRTLVQGSAASQRHELHITDGGIAALHALLRDADGQDISDFNRFIVVLAFLSQLPEEQERANVLRRRLEFLAQPGSFFYDGDVPQREADMTDSYRRGMFVVARAHSRAERAWLREMLAAE